MVDYLRHVSLSVVSPRLRAERESFRESHRPLMVKAGLRRHAGELLADDAGFLFLRA